jgi:molybdate transport system regulatory protein
MTNTPATFPHLHLRLTFRDGCWIGPGKADLLQGIAETGSIAAAGRRMKMSYKRAGSLAEALNAMFNGPLIASSRGGAGHGGASLTDLGQQVLGHYRALQSRAANAGGADIAALMALVAPIDMSDGK